MREQDLSQAILLENGLKHFVLNLWVWILAINGPILATVDIFSIINVADNLTSNLHSFIRGEEAKEADRGRENDTVSK